MHELIYHHTVVFLILLCLPISAVFLIPQRKTLGLDTFLKTGIAPFFYVAVGLLSVVVFSILHDLNQLPHWSFHHQGMLIVFPLFFPLIAKLLKKDFLTVADALSVSIPGIIAALKVYCLIQGCCYGAYISGTEVRWPIREAFIGFNLAFCCFLLVWNRKKHIPGILLSIYMFCYGLFRVAEVGLRADPHWSNNRGDLVFGFIALGLGSLLFCVVVEYNARDKRKTRKV